MLYKVANLALGMMKLSAYKALSWKNLYFGARVLIMPSVSIQVSKDGTLSLGNHVSIRKNVELNVRNDAKLIIGDNSFINSGCIITAHSGVYIGNNVEFGPNVSVFDHDHKFKSGYEAKDFDVEDIYIGDNVWIGSGTIILKGSVIGQGSVVAAGSIVKGTIPENSLYIQKRKAEIIQLDRETSL